MKLERYCIYRDAGRDVYCIALAKSPEHALEIAGRHTALGRGAYARLELPVEKQKLSEYCERWWKPSCETF